MRASSLRKLAPVVLGVGLLLTQVGVAAAAKAPEARVEPIACGLFQGGTRVVATGSRVIITGGWSAKTKLQVLAFALSAKWVLKVDGKSVFVPLFYKPIEQIDGGDWLLPFEYPAGRLGVNKTMHVEENIVLRFSISDGYGTYPKGPIWPDPFTCAITTVGGGDVDGDGAIDAYDNCPTIANPDQLDRYGSPQGDACETDADWNDVPDTQQTDICVSIDGASKVANPGVTCSTTNGGGADLANIAVASGAGSSAAATNGQGNTASAADAGVATATTGSYNYAQAIGSGSHATAANGDSNSADAYGLNASAIAGGISPAAPASFNFALADGDGTTASARAADGCEALADSVTPAATCP